MEDENQPSQGLRKHWWIAGACIALFVCAGLVLPNVLKKEPEAPALPRGSESSGSADERG